MDRLKAETKFIQYQVWSDCRNNCKFCFMKHQPPTDKIKSLNFILNKLDDPEVYEYNEVGFIGGEIFDNQLENPEVRKLFYDIFRKVSTIKNFNKVYIATALNFDMKPYLIPFLDFLREIKLLDKVLLCTSYDLKYRFHTEKSRLLWESNMLELHDKYPEMHLHVETILTQFFINAVLEDRFSISEFCKKFHTRIDYLEPSSGYYYHTKKECSEDIPEFFPTKDSFIKFLEKTAIQSNEIDLQSFLSLELRSSKLYFLEYEHRGIFDNRRDGDGRCKPLDKTKLYEIGFIDSEDTMQDIVKMVCSMID